MKGREGGVGDLIGILVTSLGSRIKEYGGSLVLFTDEFQTNKIRKCIVPNVCTTVVIHYTVVLFKVFFQIKASSQAISSL